MILPAIVSRFQLNPFYFSFICHLQLITENNKFDYVKFGDVRDAEAYFHNL